MFSHRHYVPVLRWKRAEQAALKELLANDKVFITPLIEITPRRWKLTEPTQSSLDDNLIAETATQLKDSWNSNRAFIDLGHIPATVRSNKGEHLLSTLFKKTMLLELGAIPTTGLTRTVDYQQAVADVHRIHKKGVCVRLAEQDLLDGQLPSKLDALLRTLHADCESTDLIVDLRLMTDAAINIKQIQEILPHLPRWRTFTVLSGSFPKDLSKFKVGEHLLEREEWAKWKDSIRTPRSRMPSYGDYTIQHPYYSEPPGRANFSASIRYTSDSDWVIMRGEGVFNDNGPGFDQWPAIAQMLCAREEFCGKEFSYGDRYIYEMSLQTEKPGSAETWLRAGISHHLTYVARQIRALPGSAMSDTLVREDRATIRLRPSGNK